MRNRPTGLVRPWQVKRYQYQRCGARPPASTLTVWSRAGPVTSEPRRTTRSKPGSLATSQRTSTWGPTPEPGVAASVGVTRVQRTTESGRGSPEATPCTK